MTGLRLCVHYKCRGCGALQPPHEANEPCHPNMERFPDFLLRLRGKASFPGTSRRLLGYIRRKDLYLDGFSKTVVVVDRMTRKCWHTSLSRMTEIMYGNLDQGRWFTHSKDRFVPCISLKRYDFCEGFGKLNHDFKGILQTYFFLTHSMGDV